jgi:Uma2 family endonuclease
MDSTMAVAQRMTLAEYVERDDLPRWTNLIDGEVVVSQPTPRHQRVLADLATELNIWCRGGSRGEATMSIDVELDDHNCFAPDVLWYRPGREPEYTTAVPQPLPDIAVEIRSPSTWHYDIGTKKARYEQHGLPELWLVDTAADVVLVFRRSTPRAPRFDVLLELARGDALTPPLLPGFALALDELFGPLGPAAG